MANLDLYIDIAGLRAVLGFANSSPFELPDLVAGDSLNARIRLLERTAGWPSRDPFSFVPTTNLTLELAIGTALGDYLATQFIWTPSTDLNDPYFEAVVPLNTSEIRDAVAASDPAEAKLHIRKVGADGKKTVLLQKVNIAGGIIDDSDLVNIGALTPLSLESAVEMFLGRVIKGPVTWVCDTDPTKRRDTFVAPDGTWHEDPSP